jgi:hypothetical protein
VPVRSVLIVDDNSLIRQMLREFFLRERDLTYADRPKMAERLSKRLGCCTRT